jgi:exoribonuclease II
MLARRGETLGELDARAQAQAAPYEIITADCSSPREIDDGVFVEPLMSAREMYRVGVCVADTSCLYSNGDIFRQALTNTEARYWQMPNGEQAYEPMIDSTAIGKLELKQGRLLSALVVSFVVGERQGPTDVDIAFHDVLVEKNLTYKKFGEECRYRPNRARYGKASAFILKHLAYRPGGDDEGKPRHTLDTPEDAYRALMHVPAREGWARGARINESYMIAANHLVGKVFQAEGRPAIYRVHDTTDEAYLEFMPPNVARYTKVAGYHEGLGLDAYCRVTSPLRRLEDFMMLNQLKQRSLGKPVTEKDGRDLSAAIQRLNQQVVTDIGRGPLRLHANDIMGRRRLQSVPQAEAG